MVTAAQCAELEGHVVELRVTKGSPVDRPALECRLVSVEQRDGEDVIYVEPVTNANIGLALPMRFVRSLTVPRHRVL